MLCMPYVNLILDYLRKPSLITFQRAKGIFFFTLLTILPSPNQILNEIILTPNWLIPKTPWKVSRNLFSHLVKRKMLYQFGLFDRLDYCVERLVLFQIRSDINLGYICMGKYKCKYFRSCINFLEIRTPMRCPITILVIIL